MDLFSDESTFSKRSACFLTLAGCAVFLLLLFWHSVLPEVNDDFGISALLADPGCDRVPFVSPWLASPLHWLMLNCPIVNWWSVAVFSFCVLAWAGVNYPLARTLPRGLYCLTALPLLLLSYRFGAYLMTYTRSATLIAAGGGALCLYAVFGSSDKPERVICFALGCVLAALGVAMRHLAAYIGVLFTGTAAAALLVLQLHSDPSRAGIRRAAGKGGWMLLLLCLVLGVSLSYAAEPGTPYGEYVRFRDSRASVIDYKNNLPLWEDNSEAYLAAGISSADYTMCRSWNGYDTEIVTAEKLDALASFRQLSSFEKVFNMLFRAFCNRNMFYMLLLTVPFLVWDFRRYFPPLALAGMVTTALMVYLCLLGRMPRRVSQPILAAAITLALTAGGARGTVRPLAARYPEASPRLRRFLSLGCVFISLAVSVLLPPPEAPEFTDGREQRIAIMDCLSERDGVYFHLVEGALPNITRTDPWAVPDGTVRTNVFSLGGWRARMPHLVSRLESVGIENPVRALTERDDVYAEYSPTHLLFMQEHYGADITASRAASLPEGLYDKLTFAAYLHAVPDGDAAAVQLSPVTAEAEPQLKNAVRWRFTGTLADPAPANRRLYCNATVCGERRTFTVDLAEDGSFTAVFYALPPEAEPADADFVFFFR